MRFSSVAITGFLFGAAIAAPSPATESNDFNELDLGGETAQVQAATSLDSTNIASIGSSAGAPKPSGAHFLIGIKDGVMPGELYAIKQRLERNNLGGKGQGKNDEEWDDSGLDSEPKSVKLFVPQTKMPAYMDWIDKNMDDVMVGEPVAFDKNEKKMGFIGATGNTSIKYN